MEEAAKTQKIDSIYPDPEVIREEKNQELVDEKMAKNPLRIIIRVLFFLMAIWSLASLVIMIAIPAVLGKIMGEISYIYRIYPQIFWAVPILSVSSAYLFFLFQNIKKWNKPAWILALTYPIPVFLTSLTTSFVLAGFTEKMNRMAGGTSGVQGLSLLSFVNSFGIITAATLILLLVSRKNIQKTKVKRSLWSLISGFIVTVLLVGTSISFALNAYIGAQEKPFIGFSKGKEALGRNPIFFGYLPERVEPNGVVSSTNGDGRVTIPFNDPESVTQLDRFLIVIEQTVRPDLKDYMEREDDGLRYYYSSNRVEETNNLRQLVVFEKDGVWVSLVSVTDKIFTEEELIKIAKSAY